MSKNTVILIVLAFIVVGTYVAIRSKDGLKPFSGQIAEATSDPSLFADWQEFTPQSQKFKVQLPSKPQYAKDVVAIPDSDKKRYYEIFASEKIDGTLFMISLITYPPELDTTNTRSMLQAIVEELMHSKKDNRLKEVSESLYQMHETLDFNLESKEFEIEGKTFMVDKTLYVLTYIAKKSDFNPAEFNHFVDSFVLLQKTAPSK